MRSAITVESTMSVNSSDASTRAPLPVRNPVNARTPVHSMDTHGSSPMTYPSWPGGISNTSSGENSRLVPSGNTTPNRPEITTPT